MSGKVTCPQAVSRESHCTRNKTNKQSTHLAHSTASLAQKSARRSPHIQYASLGAVRCHSVWCCASTRATTAKAPSSGNKPKFQHQVLICADVTTTKNAICRLPVLVSLCPVHVPLTSGLGLKFLMKRVNTVCVFALVCAGVVTNVCCVLSA
jgi:hypothetical protein